MKFVLFIAILIATRVCWHSGSTSKTRNKEQDGYKLNLEGSVCAAFGLLYRSFM